MYKLLTDAIGLTSTYDTDYKCEYKQRHYSEYLQLTHLATGKLAYRET